MIQPRKDAIRVHNVVYMFLLNVIRAWVYGCRVPTAALSLGFAIVDCRIRCPILLYSAVEVDST